MLRWEDDAEVLGVTGFEPGVVVVVVVVGVAVMSPLELPRMRLEAFGVVAGVVGPELPGGPLLLRSDLLFLVFLLLVRFSAMRSLRTHSSYRVFQPV